VTSTEPQPEPHIIIADEPNQAQAGLGIQLSAAAEVTARMSAQAELVALQQIERVNRLLSETDPLTKRPRTIEEIRVGLGNDIAALDRQLAASSIKPASHLAQKRGLEAALAYANITEPNSPRGIRLITSIICGEHKGQSSYTQGVAFMDALKTAEQDRARAVRKGLHPDAAPNSSSNLFL